MRVDIYSKPRCSLCEKARAVVEEVRTRLPFELYVTDILQSPDLFETWRYDIPVVLIDGVPAFKHRVEPEVLEARLREVMNGTPIAKTVGQDG
ncbi:glutaredoxin family protein [Corallococcus praedator]|uniref:Glutaredoxin family protein n=1 Tax=Corallococcus praedator TaxID=2316724 RepID=A0ABX9QN34_9BACT|nr:MULTISPECIES: glutaredoxin family protein [Corallococcus]RKH06308.1 glutaredoxin family protein [Corallococcus sp. CA047B]RKH22597.1 glutaredoxin family protein [Corallococcus sp. CA031C]RKI11756.1 glutaredoxin family protein [Corallococcus praedator]